MPKKRKSGAINTTISVKWGDKNRFRRLARKIKVTKNGDVYESDSIIFNRVLQDYMDRHPNEIANTTTSTYPIKTQDVPQQD